MNYYPNNLYQNYSYPNTNNYIPQIQNNQYAQPQPQLQGKVVESEDMVKISEIPFGTYGVFPKADLNEIYIKTWNNNGTTKILTYKPIELEEKEEVDTNALLLARIESIESKLDKITEGIHSVPTTSAVTAPKEKGKETVKYEY